MSLIYLITSLPELKRNKPLPISRKSFVHKVRSALEPAQLADFDLVLLFEEVEETIRTKSKALAHDDGLSGEGIETALEKHRNMPLIDLTEYDWVYIDAPFHVLLRRWYQAVYARGKSWFLKEWVRFSLNLDEAVAAILAKQNNLIKDDYLQQLKGRFDSCSQQIMHNYDDANLGIAKRFAWYTQVKNALSNPDFLAGEKDLNSLRLKEMDKLLGSDIFSIDVVLAYYFHMRILEREASFGNEKGKEILDLILHDDLEELYGY